MADYFINPYNFVLQNSPVSRGQNEYTDTVSGVISCRIIVKDKLALPDHEHSTAKNEKGAKYDFYKINGEPIIPGSEIRGVIRSIYETLTGSCYSIVNSNTLTKRVSVDWKNIASPCIVKFENGDWYIYPAKKLSKEERQSGISGLCRRWKSSPNLEIKNRKLKFITQYYTVKDETAEKILCTGKMDGFREIISAYKKNNSSNAEFIECIEALENSVEYKNPFVAFYKYEKGKITFFSPAQLGGRTAYENTVTDLLGEYAPCNDIDFLCPACGLFGTVTGKSAAASKLRFSDASPVTKILLDDYTMLPPLSSPKTTSVEFYSKKGFELRDVTRWDYDENGVTLNGRKYYFHSKAQKANPADDLITGQFATRTAPAKSEFSFDIFFEKISQTEQLGKLLYCLTLGENDINSNLMQKLGAGKPVGYGSVKIVVDKIAVRNADNRRYSLAYPKYDELVADETVFDGTALETLKKFADYNYVISENVSYPSASGGAFKWFANNRPTKPPIFKNVLPEIGSAPSALRLPAFVAAESRKTVTENKTSAASAKNFPKRFDESKFNINSVYIAAFKDTFQGKNGIDYANITVNGESASVPAKALPRNIQSGDTLRVRYDGMNGIHPRFFVLR